MPLYEYQCSKCGKVFEVLQKFSDQPLTVHEDCGGDVVRLLSAPAFHFKGTGWYATDYAKSSSSSPAHSDSAKNGESKTEAKSESSGESKSSESKSSPSKPAKE